MAAHLAGAPHALALPPHTRLCVAITGRTAQEMIARSRHLLPQQSFQELRLDTLANPADALPLLQPYLQEHSRSAIFLATCRPLRSGGHFSGTGREELQILLAAAGTGCRMVDLSLETAEELGPDTLPRLRSQGAAVLLSFHDFAATGDLEAVLARMRPFDPDLYKVVPTAHSLDDSLGLLRFLKSASRQPPQQVITIAMGESGLITRILGPGFGSVFTFAAATDAEATAPGQLTAHTLQDLYRIGNISPQTHLFGVAGDPIRSSLSPLMHNRAFGHLGLDAVYIPLLTTNPESLLRAARELPLSGFSVTMPLKQSILPLLDEVDPLARRIGAVNTVSRTSSGQLLGSNTDAAGIVLPLEQRLPLRGARVLVLGAGGAARAAVFGCLDRGAAVHLCNRNTTRAEALAEESGAQLIDKARLRHERFDVLINATPAGMRGNSSALPIEDDELHTELVFDLVYNPLETPLLHLARARGLQVIPGIEMFLQQGARQFETWTGQPAPVDVMRSAVLDALTVR